MKRNKLEKWLLLEASGELSPRQLRQLERELAVSEDARILRQELGRLRGSILLPEIEPSPWAVTKIAACLREERRSAFIFSNSCHSLRSLPRNSWASLALLGWKPALATAACLMVVTGILNFHGEQTSSASVAVVAAAGVDVWNDPLEEDLSRLESQIVAISGSSLDIMEM